MRHSAIVGRTHLHYEVLGTEPERVVVLYDDNTGLSITNNAENVVESVIRHVGFKSGVDRMIYQDTDGNFDELVILQDRFHDFHLLRAWSLDQAITSLGFDHGLQGHDERERATD